MVNLIVDYTRDGVWMHQAVQIFWTDDEQAAAAIAVSQTRAFGCVPLAVTRIYGRYTLDQLSDLKEGPHKIIWCDPRRLKEAMEAERQARKC